MDKYLVRICFLSPVEKLLLFGLTETQSDHFKARLKFLSYLKHFKVNFLNRK